MNKKNIIVIFVLFIVLLGIISLRKINNNELTSKIEDKTIIIENNLGQRFKTLDLNKVFEFVKNRHNNINFEDQLFDLEILAHIVEPRTKNVIIFVQIPEFSGATGNAGGDIIKYNIISNKFDFIDVFLGNWLIIKKTLTIKDETLIVFSQLIESGSCCLSGKESIIDLHNLSRSINITGGVNINIPESIETYLKRYNLEIDPLELSESIEDYKWVVSKTVKFKRIVNTQINSDFPTETWQYNIGTKEYKLIKAE